MSETDIVRPPFEFELIKVTRLIVHRIFTRTDDEVPPIRTSTKLTELDIKGLHTLQNRIVKALGSSQGVEMDIRRVDEGSFFRYAAFALHHDDDAHFITTSAEMPKLLNEAQSTRRPPGGLVLVIKGIIGVAKKPFLSVIKAEVHEGFLAEEDDTAVFMSYLDELALTPSQKLYKIGLVVFDRYLDSADITDYIDPNNYRVFVYDHNMTAKETRSAAFYFYSQFLGFEIQQSSKKLTRDFYNLTREFISKLDLDDEEKMDLQQSLYTELRVSNKATVQVSEFAETYLPLEFRDDYSEFMAEKGFPATAVPKDLEYIKHSLRRRKVVYSSKVEIHAPPDKFDELVTVVSEDETSTTLRIVGKIVSQE
jgi:hypothetical protein